MKKLRSNLVGIDQGDVTLFSDFQDGGNMWTGHGPRERRRTIQFSESFSMPPVVQASVTLWDVDTATPLRAEVTAESVTPQGCDLVFRTWGDSRFARLRVAWLAMGELPNSDDWELY